MVKKMPSKFFKPRDTWDDRPTTTAALLPSASSSLNDTVRPRCHASAAGLHEAAERPGPRPTPCS